MSEVTTDLVWYPPEFLAQDRLPSQARKSVEGYLFDGAGKSFETINPDG